MKRRENPKGNKEIWESREMSLVVFMKPILFLEARFISFPPLTASNNEENRNETEVINW